MDERNQSEQLMKTWAEAQQKLLTNWLESMQSSASTPGTTLWNQLISTWQTSVQQTMDAQALWLRRWTESVTNNEGTPDELRERVRQGQDLLVRWTESQQQFWQVWFDSAKNLASQPGIGTQANQNLLTVWQENVSKLVELQSEWVRRWAPTR